MRALLQIFSRIDRLCAMVIAALLLLVPSFIVSASTESPQEMARSVTNYTRR
jgi:hypothetical protein